MPSPGIDIYALSIIIMMIQSVATEPACVRRAGPKGHVSHVRLEPAGLPARILQLGSRRLNINKTDSLYGTPLWTFLQLYNSCGELFVMHAVSFVIRAVSFFYLTGELCHACGERCHSADELFIFSW